MTTKRTSSTHRKKLASKDSQSYRPTLTKTEKAEKQRKASAESYAWHKNEIREQRRIAAAEKREARKLSKRRWDPLRQTPKQPLPVAVDAGAICASPTVDELLACHALDLLAQGDANAHGSEATKPSRRQVFLNKTSWVPAMQRGHIRSYSECEGASIGTKHRKLNIYFYASGSTSSVPVEFRNTPEVHDTLRLPKHWPTGVTPLSRLQRLAGRMDDLRPVQAAQLWHYEHNYRRLREWHVPDIDGTLSWEKSGGIRHGDDWTGAIEYDTIVAWRLEVLRCATAYLDRRHHFCMLTAEVGISMDEAMRDYAWTWPPPTADPGWGSGTGWGDDTSVADTNVRF
ncbi:hypothetical protein B0H13DRAFT_1916656 [Mycena leptocephala]|nr:hypothetical protein B0H13DRAFT_1916656 [Mycena leptocephala]